MTELRPLLVDNICYGSFLQENQHLLVFGNCNLTLNIASKLYPRFSFRTLKQVHGNTVVNQDTHLRQDLEADAHFTSEANVALCIQTADCIPILIFNGKLLGAAHCGWRGVEKKTLPMLLKNFNTPLDLIGLGPHLQFSSFEVHKEVGLKILSCLDKMPHLSLSSYTRNHSEPDKTYIHLSKVLIDSCKNRLDGSRIIIAEENTLEDKRYYSFRRAPQNKGRNLSFIVRESNSQVIRL